MDLKISEIEFNEIKETLKTYFETKPEFSDYNFEASGLSLLMDMLAYSIHYNAYYLNMNFNEVFLDSALYRKNIVSHAKSLNYVPRRSEGAEAYINMEIISEDRPLPTHEIYLSKYSKFVSNGFSFYTDNDYIFNNANNYGISNIKLKQGEVQTQTETSDGTTKQSFVIQSPKIDNGFLKVYINSVLWANENDLSEVDKNSETYIVEETEEGYVKIIFGNDVIGKIPPTGHSIVFKYADTNGSRGNNLSDFSLNQNLLDNFSGTWDNSNFTITLVKKSLSGADIETKESIALNAPKMYESYGKLTTTRDWEAYLSQNAIVDIVNVWGGEENIVQPKYGTVFLAIKPVGTELLTNTQKTALGVFIDNRIIAPIRYEFVDPEYFRFDITLSVYYSFEYNDQITDVQTNVENVISTYFSNTLSTFDNMVQHADLVKSIKDVDGVSNVLLSMQPYFYFSKNSTCNYYWELENKLLKGSIICNIETGGVNEGFYDDKNGNIISKQTEKTIGKVDYSNGVIEINDLLITATEPSKGFTIYFDTVIEDVYFKKNRIVSLENITTTMTKFTT